MRDLLIDILKGFRANVGSCLKMRLPEVENIADYLLSNGVIVIP